MKVKIKYYLHNFYIFAFFPLFFGIYSSPSQISTPVSGVKTVSDIPETITKSTDFTEVAKSVESVSQIAKNEEEIKDPKVEEISTPAPIAPVESSTVPETATEPVASIPEPSTIELENPPERDNTFRITNPTPVSDPSVDAGYGVMRYKSKFLYAHSTRAFSPLKGLWEGSEIIVEMDGVVSRYTIKKRVVEEKAVLDSNSGLRAAIYSAAYRGSQYDLVLMTCGNGANDDPNMRLILFATKNS